MSWTGSHSISALAGLLFFAFSPRLAWANEDLVPGSRYTSAAAGAMGEAYLPLADDPASALFYNPAGLARGLTHKNPEDIEPFNLSVYGAPNYFSQISGTSLGFAKVTSLSSYLPTLQANPGQWTSIGSQFVPSMYYKGFAFGVLAQTQLTAVANGSNSVSYRSLYQLVPTLGTGIRLAGGIIKIGYSVQWVNEAVGSVTNASATASPLGYNQNLAQGSGFSQTVGFTFTVPREYLPQLNIVARNIGGTHYSSTSLVQFTPTSTGTPATEPMSIDTSLSMIDKLGSGIYMTDVAELRDATNTSQVTIMGRVSLGTEISIRDRFLVRAGWGDGYPDAGFGLRTKSGDFSFAWMSEELGDSYHDLRDIRYVLQYQVHLF
jgi:hypothetical protein